MTATPQQQPKRSSPLVRLLSSATAEDASYELDWKPVEKQPSKKEIRAEENDACLGDQRNPRTPLLKVPGAKMVGLLIRDACAVFWGRHTTETKSFVQAFGTRDAHGPSYALVEEYRCFLRKATGAGFDLKSKLKHGAPSVLQASLVDAWLRKAGASEISLKSVLAK